MKKFMMTLVAAMMAVTMNAQTNFYVGGSLGYSTSSFDGTTTESTLTFLPEFGIQFNDKMGVGVEVGYTGTTREKEAKVTESTFTFAPYFRYTALKLGKVAVFGDAKFAYSIYNDQDIDYDDDGKAKAEDDKLNTWGLHLQPGISYSLNDKFSLVAKFGDVLSYSSKKPDVSGAKATSTFKILDLTNTISFGFFYNF